MSSTSSFATARSFTSPPPTSPPPRPPINAFHRSYSERPTPSVHRSRTSDEPAQPHRPSRSSPGSGGIEKKPRRGTKDDLISHIQKARMTAPRRTLDTLDLSHREMEEFPLECIALIKAEVCRLALSYNRLVRLPDEIVDLSRLRYLNLRANAFPVFPQVLTNMPQLEILELGRNRIRKLPDDPGTLVRLKVLSLSKNKLTALPAYLARFKDLRIFKVDANQIEWPRRNVRDRLAREAAEWAAQAVERGEDLRGSSTRRREDLEMEAWIRGLREWLAENAEGRGSATDGGDADAESDCARHHAPQHSAHSLSGLSGNETDTPPLGLGLGVSTGRSRKPITPPLPPFKFPPEPDLPSPTLLSPTRILHAPHHHGRNASHTAVTQRSAGAGAVRDLRGKKSLPDLRREHRERDFGGADRTPVPGRQGSASPRMATTDDVSPVDSTTSHIAHENAHLYSPHAPSDPVTETAQYFARLGVQSDPGTPQELTSFLDAARGLLFALTQTHTAIRQFAIVAPPTVASITTRMLSPAGTALAHLIDSLKGPDTRAVLDAVRGASTAFSQVVGAVQAQLKETEVDARFARTLVLMLYGAMAEIAEAWKTIGPLVPALGSHLAAPLRRDSAAEKTPRPPAQARVPAEELPPTPPLPNGAGASTPRRKSRRQAGSYTSEDLELGAALHRSTGGGPDDSWSPGTGARQQLPSLSIRPPSTQAPPPYSTRSFSFEPSLGTIPSGSPGGSGGASQSMSRGGSSSGSRSGAVGEDELLDQIEAAAELGASVWPALAGGLDDAAAVGDPVLSTLRERAVEGEALTRRLRESHERVKSAHNAGRRGLRAAGSEDIRSLFDDASAFNKLVIWTASTIKGLSTRRQFPVNLGHSLSDLQSAASELTVQLHVSSFRPTTPSSRPHSPIAAPPRPPRRSTGASPASMFQFPPPPVPPPPPGPGTGTMGRSHSANASGGSSHRPAVPPPPRSAQSGQSHFRFPPVPAQGPATPGRSRERKRDAMGNSISSSVSHGYSASGDSTHWSSAEG